MLLKLIAPNITVDLDNSAEVHHNGERGDKRRSIWAEQGTDIVWIETNGGTEVYEDMDEALRHLFILGEDE